MTAATTDPRTLDKIHAALARIIDPCSAAHGQALSVVDMGLVRGVELVDGALTLRLYLTSPICTMLGKFQEMAEQALLGIAGVERVTVEGDRGLDWPGLPGARFTYTGVSGEPA